jgi:protein O-mannosyl-transferase
MKHRQQKKKSLHPLAGETEKTQQTAICIFLVIATLAIYWQVLGHDFSNLDDPKYVTKNFHVQAGLSLDNIKWAFTTVYFSYWIPMTWLSHIIDFQLFGLNPKGHHLTSLLIHIANALILFGVLLKMTGALWRSGLVAALFALHPLNVESVVWIAERKNVLSTFFWILTLGAYAHYVKKPTIKKYGLVALFLALGLMSKPMLVTLPFVLLLLDYWPLERWKPDRQTGAKQIENPISLSRLIWEKAPFFLMVVGSSITVFILQKMGGAVKSIEAFPLEDRIINALVSYLSYLQKMIWPSELSVFYAHAGNTLPVWKGLVSAALIIVFTAWVIRKIWRIPYLAVGWFWYLGTLVPVIGIVQIGEQAMADRYAYVPLIGIFIIVAWGVPDLLARWNHREKAPTLFAGLVVALMVATSTQVAFWKNDIKLFKHALK